MLPEGNRGASGNEERKKPKIMADQQKLEEPWTPSWTEAHRREDREYDKIRDEARKSMERKHRERMEALQRRGTGEILWSHNSASSERQYVEEPLPDTKEFGEEHIRNKREARQETRTGDAPPRRPPSKTGPSKMGPSDTGRPKKSFGILTLANFMRRNR